MDASDSSDSSEKGFTTRIVHSDRIDPIEHGSLHKPVHATVAYGYDRAEDLAAVFQGKQKGYTYGRQVNPTVEALEAKVQELEQSDPPRKVVAAKRKAAAS